MLRSIKRLIKLRHLFGHSIVVILEPMHAIMNVFVYYDFIFIIQ